MFNNQENTRLNEQSLAYRNEELERLEKRREELQTVVSDEDYSKALEEYRSKLNSWFEEFGPLTAAAAAAFGFTFGGISAGPVGGVFGGLTTYAGATLYLRGRRLAALDGMKPFPRDDGHITLNAAPLDQVLLSIKNHVEHTESGEYTREISSDSIADFKEMFSSVCATLSKRSKVGKYTIAFALTNLFAALNLDEKFNNMSSTTALKSLGEVRAVEKQKGSVQITFINLELMMKATEIGFTGKCCWMFCQGKRNITFTIKYKKWKFDDWTSLQQAYGRSCGPIVRTEQTTQDDPETVTSTS